MLRRLSMVVAFGVASAQIVLFANLPAVFGSGICFARTGASCCPESFRPLLTF